MLAAAGAGLHASVADAAAAMSGTRAVHEPDPATSADYDRLFAVYRQLYPRLKETLAALQGCVKEAPAAAQV